MHYKNGREAKAGDIVVNLPTYGQPVTGILHSLVAGSVSCNANLQPLNSPYTVTIGECLHVDDIKAAADWNAVPDATQPVGGPPAPQPEGNPS